jgi:NADH:ubiquinone oxidoreductase subunit 5 (subunit L)/multisubunit Na+/H+ antiporter MnhA subunit
MLASPLALIATCVLLLPMGAFLLLAGLVFVYRTPSERFIARLTAAVFALALAGSIATLAAVIVGPRHAFEIYLGRWFAVPGYVFELTLLIDPLSATLMVLTTAIIGIVGRFSVTYMHRERGYGRFFVLMHLFATGMLLLVMGGSVDLLYGGWELVGITSVLLIAFFQERAEPVRNSLRAFIIYRVCDAGLLLGAVLVHHYAHTARLDPALGATQWPLGATHLDQGPATLIAILFMVAAMGKSAQFPVSNWLPRAMEGPTPSSALFYGALSIHAGVYLLLRTAPLFAAAPLARTLLIVVGLLSAVCATIAGRAQTDVKNALAYASIAQVGIMFVEIGLGLYVIAAVHLVGHACVRTLQLLKAPSALHEAHHLDAAAGKHMATGAQLERMVPGKFQRWLYGLALERFHLDALLNRLAGAVMALARRVDALDRRWAALQSGTPHGPHESDASARAARADKADMTSRATKTGDPDMVRSSKS